MVRDRLVHNKASSRRVTSAVVARPTSHMQSFAPIRFAVAAGLTLSMSLMAQSTRTPQATPAASTLPATQPTTPAPPPVPLTPSQRPPKRAQVTYADGTLSVSADNSSLNQILRQIATDTGMKITGGVADERVFGQYGPAAPAQILAQLLDGTSSNMILVQRDNAELGELILTPRQGGPTPPNPNAAAFDDRNDSRESQQVAPAQVVQPMPTPAAGNPIVPPPNPGAPTTTPPADSSQPDSPNGVKTPQQIYEQLQRLRSQQQQQQQQPQPQTPPQ
jgi:hypothetical protein